ncbi:MAG: hypothetical protein JJU29_13350 [Verrucomicrobia bacterium]|nr:hypothetical protein [Verrucomicrobiota bacterium]MCH8512720.1 hypothetical protein [Kiritimatiellia bacterium]
MILLTQVEGVDPVAAADKETAVDKGVAQLGLKQRIISRRIAQGLPVA